MVRPAQVHSPLARRNRLALASLVLSLLCPIGAICAALGSGIVLVSLPYTEVWYTVGFLLLLAGIPATVAAIVSGHAALRRADRQPFQRPMRGASRAALVLGYGSSVTYLAVFGFAVWVTAHGPRMHLVW